ncbi:protein quiver-like isoform X3 [Leptotrombidium deliense]|uniref:UPAR/Ly6 domain-containing protein qvr n=1 Tax=Leptotrombidium deliense TaxID=299467 RepID=A0A443SVI1_9ACAR|nr:protein quiver-like isoform X3 [Leptotrombidium deliense]
MCYDCESTKNPYCADTFNTSIHAQDHVPSKSCYGCCVKIVMNQNKPDQYIRRTCTKEIAINLFMVDHVCMEESDGQGHMCFCESDYCNRADKPKYTSLLISCSFVALMLNVFKK